ILAVHRQGTEPGREADALVGWSYASPARVHHGKVPAAGSSPRLVSTQLGTRHSPNGRYGIFGRDRADHSGLMPANWITLPHFSFSAEMCLRKWAGEPTGGVPPRSASFAFIFGSARAALMSLLSLSTISTGVALGAPMPSHALAS